MRKPFATNYFCLLNTFLLFNDANIQLFLMFANFYSFFLKYFDGFLKVTKLFLDLVAFLSEE